MYEYDDLGQMVRVQGSVTGQTVYVATDLNGNPVQTLQLNCSGKAIIEVKTGNADLSSGQAAVYPAAQAGRASGAGKNAIDSGLYGQIGSTPVYILRPA